MNEVDPVPPTGWTGDIFTRQADEDEYYKKPGNAWYEVFYT
jgi:hypothetical protein